MRPAGGEGLASFIVLAIYVLVVIATTPSLPLVLRSHCRCDFEFVGDFGSGSRYRNYISKSPLTPKELLQENHRWFEGREPVNTLMTLRQAGGSLTA